MRQSVLFIALVTTLALSQEKSGGGVELPPHLGPEAPSHPPIALDWNEQRALATTHEASRAWRAAHPDWTMTFDARTRFPWRAYGPGIPVAPRSPSHADVVAAAHAVVGELARASGVQAHELEFVTAVPAGPLWYIDFAQHRNGARVFNGGLTMRIDSSGRLVMWGGSLVDLGGVARAPAIASRVAADLAVAHLRREGFVTTATTFETPVTRLLVHVDEGRDRRVPTLAWMFETRTSAPIAWWKVFVDATSGSVLLYWNDVRECGHDHHDGDADAPSSFPALGLDTRHDRVLFVATMLASVSGVASGTVHDGVLPQAAPVSRTFNDLTVNLNGTNVVTDGSGFYSFSGGGTSIPVASGLDGIHVTTNNTAGVQASFSTMASSGTLDILWDDSNSTLAERDAFYFTNQAWHRLMTCNPAETRFNAALPANVNLAQTCNAFYDGLSINFFAPGAGCINTAYSQTIAVHEYGHHVSITIYASHGKNMPGGMGEGYSDCQSGATHDSSVVGAGWQGPGTFVRDMNNSCQWPASCGSSVHSVGRVISGAWWDTRQLFDAAYGAAGKTMMDEYLYRHFDGTPVNETESCLEFLLLNDDDANVANGTPDAAKFYDGFTGMHGIPFPIEIMEITHAPLCDTMDQLQNYQVHASATSKVGATITTATLHYSIGGGAFTPVPMTALGSDAYMGTIPVQPAGSMLRYYMVFQDDGGRLATLPSAGAAAALSFRTMRLAPFFFDGFEAASGWVTATQAGADDWHRQAPGNANHAYDPPAAFEGTACFGNDLSPTAQWNGNYPNNVFNHLTSPSINCSGRSGVTLIYRRWLTVEDGVFDHARIRISNNGGASYTTVWENPPGSGSQHVLDAGWVEHPVDIAALADGQPNVRIRFELQSDAGLNFGGWNIDVVQLAEADATPPLVTLGGTAPGNLATIRLSGTPGELGFLFVDLSLSPLFINGVGMFSINPIAATTLVLHAGVPIPVGGDLDISFIVPPASGLTALLQGALLATAPTPGASPVFITNVLTFAIP